MNDTVTIDRAEYERLIAVEHQARIVRAKQKDFYTQRVRSPRQKEYSLRNAMQEEKRLDALLDGSPIQAEMPL